MKISVKGKNDKVTKKEIKFAAEYMLNLILSQRMIKNIYVEVVAMTKGDKFADCCWIDNEVKPREFRIRLNTTKSKRGQLLALAHELVHVKQFVKGELRDICRRPANESAYSVKWKTDFVDQDKVHYYDLPWEIEAHGREYGMYVRYMHHKNINKIKF
jgi:hypothetical protein